MAILAGFIGIDRYADPRIRDLFGAARDANALWALLSDSIPDLNGVRLTNANATLANVRELFHRTLGAASEDDVVILSFAAHGSPDHHLIVADTSFEDITGTAIPMAELAERFRSSKAKSVICFLDCCFSGGAPARVLDGAPNLRDIGTPLETVAGKGRILVAASNINEPAIEDPISRHGLFTKALIECLQRAPAPISLVGILDAVISEVRIAATRLGCEQTPVFFGHVEGALTLPAIQAGAIYFREFPERAPVRVTADFQDLAAFGIGQSVLDLWKARFPTGLNSLQVTAINDYGVLSGESLLVVAPTSAGKTFVGEVAAVKTIEQGQKAVFLLPYKAIVDEKYEDFSSLYGDRLGLRVARCSGDWQDQTGAILHGKFDIAFFTYETFLGLAVAFPHLLAQIGLVVVDEVQFITDEKRGIIVELLLTNLLNARNRNVRPQLMALSAVIGSTNSFERWLGCRLLVHTERPVPLIESVMDRSGHLQMLNEGAAEDIELLPRGEIRIRRNEASSQDMIVPLVRKLVRDGEKVLVFRNVRGSCAGCAEYLATELSLPPAQSLLDALPQFDLSSDSQRLRRCLQGGTAFHSTNLQREEKNLVEAAFRDPAGAIRVLVATSTLAAGVNTPASTVVIVETAFRSAEGQKPYTVAQYKNMAGRAGRLGFERQGKSIVLADTSIEKNRLFNYYVRGTPEAIKSSFDPASSGTWIIRLLAQVGSVTRSQAAELVAGTYGGFLANIAQQGWQSRFEAQARELLRRMEMDGLLETDGPERIRLSILGHACGQSPLMLESALVLVEMLRQVPAQQLSSSTLMALTQALPEQDDDYTPIGRGRADAGRPSELSSRLGRYVASALQRRAPSDSKYYARCKRSLILLDWMEGVPVEEIERRYSPNPYSPVGHGDIRGFADATRFYLGSASRIAAIVHTDSGPTQQDIDTLLKRLEVGLPESALGLINIPAAMARGEYLALHNVGIHTVDELAAAPAELLERTLSQRRATELRTRIADAPSRTRAA